MAGECRYPDAAGFVTVLSTDSYLQGVLALNESLRLVKSRYKLHVLLGSRVSGSTRACLDKAGICVIQAPPVDLPEEYMRSNSAAQFQYWNSTFDKLLVFSLTEFKKVVYIDSDILVIKNIDHLFEEPHLSAVAAGKSYPGNENWSDLNSGIMVIEPQAELANRMIALVPRSHERTMQQGKAFGDQDVIHTAWPEWSQNSELHLHEKYNVFSFYLDHYVRRLGYKWRGPDGIHVLHFAGATKPWMRTSTSLLRHLIGLLVRRRLWEFTALLAYLAVLHRARLHLGRSRGRVIEAAGVPSPRVRGH